MKFDIPPNPIAITLLGSDRILAQAHHLAHLFQQFEFGLGTINSILTGALTPPNAACPPFPDGAPTN
jgi:hypothetical protein